jgi:hypothetical protein
MATPFGKTADGFENHSSGPTISAISFWSIGSRHPVEPGSELVNLSSAGHPVSDVDLGSQF